MVGETTSTTLPLATFTLDPTDFADRSPISKPLHNSRSIFSLFGPLDDPAVARASRLDKHHHHHSFLWPSGFASLRRIIVGAIPCSALPPVSFSMSLRRKSSTTVPETPRVISPSPAPSDLGSQDYMGPVTRSSTRKRLPTPQSVDERSDEGESDEDDEDDGHNLRRARTRSRSPIDSRGIPRMTPKNSSLQGTAAKESGRAPAANGKKPVSATNGHLAPPEPVTPSGWSWHTFSRSPSPLGLIPIHRHWRTFVHKHEVPRKALHVSIGFVVIWLYVTGVQTSSVAPYLMTALVPIAATDWLRHRYSSVNRLYVKVLGALMRESEYAGWNGVIFYLLGTWFVLYSFPKDVSVMSVLLLSWCDTAASTFGRLWGRYTPRIRRNKSLAGSLAAFLTGVATSYFFYGWLVPTFGPMAGDENFMFKGTLSLPPALTEAVGLSDKMATISGSLALGVMSICSGFMASASEVVDLFGWDDNLTIPVLSGIGIFGFLKLFG